MKFLVVGCGSIGERHIRNLKALSMERITACDVDPKRLSLMKEKYGVQICNQYKEAFDEEVDAVMVCTPPSSHIPIALDAIDHNAHVFIEKPLSHNLNRVDELIEKAADKNLQLFVGYNFRFHPGLKLVKELLDAGSIGKVLSARVEAGQYLPDWRPWQDYKQSYTAQKDLGGGIILDGSHEIDYIRWLLGEVKEVFCFAAKVSNLEVETEDTAEILLRFESGALANVHLDFVQRAYSRWCKLIGEKGTIFWDYSDNFVKLYLAKTKEWQTFNINFEPNDMYLQEIEHFIHCIREETKPLVDVTEGKRVLKIALAAKESAKAGMVKKL